MGPVDRLAESANQGTMELTEKQASSSKQQQFMLHHEETGIVKLRSGGGFAGRQGGALPVRV